MRIIIKHFTLRAAVISLSTLPIGLGTGAMGLFSGFPLLEKADSSWCYFTNSNMREDRKSLWILVKPDYALQTLYIICPRTSQWDTFQADFSADATLARYYPSGYDKWPEWRREDERYNSYGEDDPIMDPLGVNFTLKLSAGKTKKPEKVCSAVLRALQKKYGSYKDMCGGYREAIAGRAHQRKSFLRRHLKLPSKPSFKLPFSLPFKSR